VRILRTKEADRMGRDRDAQDITKRRIVYEVAGMREVPVRRGLTYLNHTDGTLTLDLYSPPGRIDGTPTAAVVLINGYSDIGARTVLGCAIREMESFVSWAQLLAASGLTAVLYETGRDPASEAESLIGFLQTNAGVLGIDGRKIGLWACSGHVPNALSVMMTAGRGVVKCAALCYGLMLDLDGSTAVADASAQYRFVNPAVGRTVEDLPDAALLVVRAGRDEFPGLNKTMDRFIAGALAANLPMTVINHPDAPHAFDVALECALSRETIRQIVGFLRFHLRA
jgi:hypothetical protein